MSTSPMMGNLELAAAQVSPTARGQGEGQGGAQRASIRSLAEQFESLFIAQMLREMKQAMTPDADSAGLGGQVMGDTVTTELALALGRAGGLGLADLLETALARLDDRASSGNAPATSAAGETVAPATPAVTVPALPVAAVASPAAVSSAYGWRVDPLDGQPRFHGGIDLRVAYGHDVRAAAAGVVTFAGERAGYGLVVMVAHGDGVETRYAHLSSAAVNEGARVAAGDVIARSGNSGRATGAHLHFEVRHHGRPLNPVEVAGLVPVATTD